MSILNYTLSIFSLKSIFMGACLIICSIMIGYGLGMVIGFFFVLFMKGFKDAIEVLHKIPGLRRKPIV